MKPSWVDVRIRVLILARVPRSGVLGAFLNPVADKESNTRGNLFFCKGICFSAEEESRFLSMPLFWLLFLSP